MKCPKCNNVLSEPQPHPDGLPGVLYRTCKACGYSRAVIKKMKKEKLKPH